MAKFFVGQRVRVVACDYEPMTYMIGAEGIVNELDCLNARNIPGHVGITVRGNERWCFLPWELEPIVPEGMQPCEWSECLWQPEGLHA